jgi:hypothetical protein
MPEVGLEPTRPCGQRILSAVGSDGQVTVASQSPAFARVSRCCEWRVLRGSCRDSCQLRNTQRNRPHQASPQIGPLGERRHPTRQAPQRGPILLHVWLLDFFQNSGVRRTCASQPTPALGPAATIPPPGDSHSGQPASAEPNSRTRCDSVYRRCYERRSIASADPSSRTRCDSPSRKPLIAKPMRRASRAVQMRRG